VIKNVPAGLGEPVFDKLQASLAHAMMGINAAHGFEYGSGFAGTAMRGSEHNDLFTKSGSQVVTSTNRSGGIQGGISNGMDIYFNVAFKPVSTIMKIQQTVDTSGNAAEIKGKGRHDPCVLPRAVPIVESMAALVLADHLLRNKNSRIS
jgi:chorismate synthase